jgi:hypothetical protein
MIKKLENMIILYNSAIFYHIKWKMKIFFYIFLRIFVNFLQWAAQVQSRTTKLFQMVETGRADQYNRACKTEQHKKMNGQVSSMPERFKTVRAFDMKIDEYFAVCNANKTFPDEAGLLLHLGMTRETYERYLRGEDRKHRGFTASLKKAKLRRESIIIREIHDSDKTPTGKIFLARQTFGEGAAEKGRADVKAAAVELRIKDDSGYFE